jgi:hypothetical protein
VLADLPLTAEDTGSNSWFWSLYAALMYPDVAGLMLILASLDCSTPRDSVTVLNRSRPGGLHEANNFVCGRGGGHLSFANTVSRLVVVNTAAETPCPRIQICGKQACCQLSHQKKILASDDAERGLIV